MAKTINTSALDAAYDWIRGRVTGMAVCSAQPTNYTEAFTTYALAKVAMTSTALTLAAGDSGQRKMTTQQKSGVSVTATDTATHVALFGSTASVLLLVTTCISQALTSGNTVTIPAFKHEFGNVT